MVIPIRNLPRLALLALALALPRAARADLAMSSPFLPTGGSGAGAAAAAAGPIELRGVMTSTDGSAFCIYDTAKKKNVWVGLNETGHDFVVKSADSGSDSVTVSYQGRIMRLELHSAKVASAPIQAAPAGPVANFVVLNPSPADEQRRLDAVAQEVRRRRAERERAVQEGANAPPPGVGPPAGGR